MDARKESNASGAAGQADPARALLLARLVPALVHRANNALAVVQGVLELGARASVAENQLAARELRALGALLGGLSKFSQRPAGLETVCDPPALVGAVEILVRPLAADLGVRLETLPAGSAGRATRADARLGGVLVALATERVLALGRSAGGAPARVRLSLRGSGARIRLVLSADRPPGGWQRPGTLDELAALARERGWPLSVRERGRAGGLLLVLPALDGGGPVLEDGDRSRRARILLLQAEGELRELCTAVLAEHGYSVREGRSWPAEGQFELVLIDAELARAEPELLGRAYGARALAVLGHGHPGGRLLPVLGKPFRPRELVEFVERCLAVR